MAVVRVTGVACPVCVVVSLLLLLVFLKKQTRFSKWLEKREHLLSGQLVTLTAQLGFFQLFFHE